MSEQNAKAMLVLAPAMGVKPQFYAGFLAYLAEHGIASKVIDYGAQGDLKDWAERDMEVALAHANEAGLPVLFMGHSVGGQLFGLTRTPKVQGALFIGSQSGYWKHWPGLKKLLIATLWYAVVPVSVRLTGRLPMKALRQGEDIPARVGLQWAEWGRDPSYIQRYAKTVAPRAFQTFSGPLHVFAIADDGYAPPISVEQLALMYEKANIVRHSLPAPLGHFGAFRSKQRERVWPQLRDALLSML